MTFYTKIAGVTFEDRQRIIAELNRKGLLEPGTELILRPDSTNPYDSKAVAVVAPNGQQLGYLPKEYAGRVSTNMLSGTCYRAFVELVTGGNVGWSYGVNLRIVYN